MLGREILIHGNKKARYYINESDSAMIVRSAFSQFEGEVEQSPYIRIALNLGGGGLIKEDKNGVETIRNWRKGSIYIGLGEACCVNFPSVEILGLAINLDAWREQGLCNYNRSDFNHAVKHPSFDNLVSSILKALWESAIIYGVESEFFKAGSLQILERLANLTDSRKGTTSSKVMQKDALAIIDELIESQMENRITIANMAASINMEQGSFSRAFSQTVGQTPFAYLTSKRISKAQQLLKIGTDITSAATYVGYSNPSKFAAAFRRYTGKSPSEWRQSLNE